MKKYNVYADPGHAWCRVPRSELRLLGVLDKVSCFSYQRGEWVYLEEDCDLSMWASAYKSAHGALPLFRETHTNRRSKIRSYDFFSPRVGERNTIGA